jgi:hypothetical protein
MMVTSPDLAHASRSIISSLGMIRCRVENRHLAICQRNPKYRIAPCVSWSLARGNGVTGGIPHQSISIGRLSRIPATWLKPRIRGHRTANSGVGLAEGVAVLAAGYAGEDHHG